MAEQIKKAPVVSAEQCTDIVDTLHTLWSLVATYNGDKLPDFPTDPLVKSQENDKLYERVVNRARVAVMRRVEALAEEAAKAYKGAVDATIAPFVAEQAAARDAYMSVPEAARKFMPAFPTVVKVPLRTVWDIFPAEVLNPQRSGILHTLGYKLGDEKGKQYLYTELPAFVAPGTPSSPRLVG